MPVITLNDASQKTEHFWAEVRPEEATKRNKKSLKDTAISGQKADNYSVIITNQTAFDYATDFSTARIIYISQNIL